MKKYYTEFRECDDCGYDYAMSNIYPDLGRCNDCDHEFSVKSEEQIELRNKRDWGQLEGNPLTVGSKEVI